ncbi:MAG: roadblock/LC7 domain-containing protein [Candidatus Aminicenantes bacterium]|nr:roadblock/LC7 domain-containing protein [Candidatus Aminicenantes bacterium]
MKFISKTVEDMIQDGKLHQAVVVDSDGLVVDARGEMYDPEILSAFAFPIQQTLRSLQETLAVERIKEVSLRTEDRKLRITLSFFVANAQDFCLMVRAPGAAAARPAVSDILRVETEAVAAPVRAGEEEASSAPVSASAAEAGADLEALTQRVLRRLQPELERIAAEAVRREIDQRGAL